MITRFEFRFIRLLKRITISNMSADAHIRAKAAMRKAWHDVLLKVIETASMKRCLKVIPINPVDN